jgi:hypothetical protein
MYFLANLHDLADNFTSSHLTKDDVNVLLVTFVTHTCYIIVRRLLTTVRQAPACRSR